MSDKIVVIDGNKAYVWFAYASFYTNGEEYVLRDKDESILNDSQQKNKDRFEYVPDIQLSIREHDPVHEESNIVILAKSSAVLRGDSNIVTKNSIIISPQQNMQREMTSQLVFETRRGIKYVDMKFQEPPVVKPYVILSTLNEEEHRQLTKLVYQNGPQGAILKVLEFKGNYYRNQGDKEKQLRYHTKETVLELAYEGSQLTVKEHRYQQAPQAIAA